MLPLAFVARALTLLRFVAVAPFVAWLRPDAPGALGALYAAVALSDWSDGRIARRANAASPRWGRLDAAADIFFNATVLAVAAARGFVAPWPAIAVAALGAGFLLRRETGARLEDRPGKLAGVLFYALSGVVTAKAVWPDVLPDAAVRAAGDAVALYAAGVVSARLAMSSWRRWTKRSA